MRRGSIHASNSAFSTIKKQFSLPFYDATGDGGLVVDDHELVDDHGVDDDRGVAVPGQVDGVCRCPL